METIPSTLAERVRLLRSYVGESARNVSDIAGIAHSLVSFIENGDRLDPRASTAIALGRVFGTTSEWLVEGKGEPPSREAVIEAFEKARAAFSGSETRVAS